MHHKTIAPVGEHLIRLPDVEARTGLSRSAIYAGMKAGTFPPVVKLGPRAAAWPLSQIEAWIAGRIESSSGVKRTGRVG